jgi:PAS domain S-box-containing protein
LGDAVGALIFAPPLLTWAVALRSDGRPARLTEALALGAAVTAASLAVFYGPLTPVSRDYPGEYLVFPFVIWAALRFGPPLTTLTTLLASAIAVWGTVNGWGPFASSPRSLVLLQTFMGVVAVTALVLAAALAERRRAGESLRQSHNLLEGVVEGTTDAVFVKDLLGRYLTINSAGAHFLGKTVAEVVGHQDRELFSPESAQKIREGDCRVMAAGEAQTYEEEVTAAGVTRTYLSTKAPYRDHQGRVIGLIGISRDITDRKRLEEELRRRAADLVEGDRRKDEFLAMLAHELRNPLAPIQNAVQVMRLLEIPETRLAYARDVVERQLRQLVRIVDDLLDVSRISRGKISLRKEPVELAAVVNQAVETSRPLIDARRHRLTVTLQAGPVRLEGDRTRLAQVVANLLNNAAKYTEEGGRIDVAVELEGDQVVIRVADTGMGIAPELLPRLFEPFTQADRSLDRAQGGLGLGLALVRNLVEMHGGTVSAASQGPGRGSEFVVRLPAALEPDPGPKRNHLEQEPMKGGRGNA